MPKYIDIGANLTDPMFTGVYRGKTKHENDFQAMIDRAKENGVVEMMVTGSNLEESRRALEMAKRYAPMLWSTVGVHPCHAADVPRGDKEEEYWQAVEELAVKGAKEGLVRAYGEFGLDYDRFHYAGKDDQIRVFKRQLDIASRVGLPLFLHSRACSEDFNHILGEWIRANKAWKGGVVHSFTGHLDELKELLDLGLYVGVNGCSLKTAENLEVAKAIPLDRLMLETDGPWCEIRPSHASHKYIEKLPYDFVKPEKFKPGAMVRSRCEPCQISNVAQVLAGLHELPVDKVAEIAYDNTVRVFGSDNRASSTS